MSQKKTNLPFRKMPSVLNKNELFRMLSWYDIKMDYNMFELYLHNWTKQEKLKKAGPRTGIYYNLVADPEWRNNIPQAVTKKYPEAILAGPTVLHAFGCQTQIPSKMWFAVLKQRSFPEFYGAKFMPRPKRWFVNFPPQEKLYGVRSLNPKQALEDGLLYQNRKNAWIPDMDDIDLDEIEFESSEKINTSSHSSVSFA